MAQATNVESWKDALLEYSDQGGAWTDISGWTNSLTKSGGERITGQAYTFEGDVAITGVGKRQPMEITARVAYTEGATDIYAKVKAAYENCTRFQIRWFPEGGEAGEFGFYTDNDSRVISDPRPVGSAESGEPAFLEFTIRTRQLQDVTGT